MLVETVQQCHSQIQISKVTHSLSPARFCLSSNICRGPDDCFNMHSETQRRRQLFRLV